MGRFALRKLDSGERFVITKDNADLDKIRVELTWQKGDLDAEAWLLNQDGLIVNDEAFVFYGSKNRTEEYDKAKFGSKKNYLAETRPMSADGAVLGPKDELTGGLETINICLSKLARDVQEIVISATLYVPNDDKVETFGEVENAKITVIDENSGDPLCCYELSREYNSEDAMVACSILLNDEGEWEFEAVGKGYSGGLQTLVDIYAEE